MRVFLKVNNSNLLLFALLYIIPIVVMASVFFNANHAASEKAEQNFTAALQQVKVYVDTELANTDRIFAQITLMTNIESLYSNSTYMNERQLVFIRSILSNLRAFEVTNKKIEKIYLYFPKMDFLVSGTGTFDKQTIGHWFKSISGLDREKIIQLVTEGNGATYLPINYTDIKSTSVLPERQAMIAYVRGIMSVRDGIPPMVVIAFINQTEILDAYDGVLPATYGNVTAVGSDGQYLFNAPPDFLENNPLSFYTERVASAHPFTHRNKGNLYKIANVKSDLADWHYILSIPERVYLANATETKLTMLLIIFIYLVTVTLASWYFYKWNYKPLHKITELIQKFGRSGQKSTNEYSYIHQSVQMMIKDNQEIFNKYETQKEDAKYGMMEKLLRPDNVEVVNLKSLLEMGLCFDKSDFYVFLFYPVQFCSEDFRIEARHYEYHDLVLKELKRCFEDVEHVYIQKSELTYVCIVNTDIEFPFITARAQQCCINIASPAFGPPLGRYTLAFSRRHGSMTSLNKAYLEALEVREYKTYWSKDDLILHEEMSSGVDMTSPYAGGMDKDVQIISHIKHQEYETAIELINEQMNSIFLTTSNPLVLTKCRMFGIVNLLLNIIGEMRSMYDLKFMEETNAAEVLLGCQSLQELKTCMSDIFNQMRDYIQQKEKDLSGSRIRAIMDFIKTNYNRPDMSITYLSQVFNKNESYISRSFKRHVGMGFLDYLHSLRIIEAKRLIKAGNNIKEISVLTGYTNETTLIRAFKRYEGITPGKLKATESHLG